MNKRTLKRAIGVSDGKELTISNDCASVHIQLQETVSGPQYAVGGDADLHMPFRDLSAALSYAVAQLALYMDGSPNR